ncbi:MAG: nucleotide exchange factor GrpE [Bacteroidota bacterium]
MSSKKEGKQDELVEEPLNDQAVEDKASQEESSEDAESSENENNDETAAEEKNDSVPTPEEQIAEAKDKYLRLYSEFENFRRRTSKEKLDLISTANKDLMADLIPVIDDFERAIKASEESDDVKALKEGLDLVYNKFKKSLETKGLTKMEVQKGDEFNDDQHEAITQIPADKGLEGKIVDVVESGYTLGEKVVRFAKVVVGAKQ